MSSSPNYRGAAIAKISPIVILGNVCTIASSHSNACGVMGGNNKF